MTASTLEKTVAALVIAGKGILAADESHPTSGKRFALLDIPFTEMNRRAFREMMIRTPGKSEHISGMILFDETLRQRTGAASMPEALARQGIIPGIKVAEATLRCLRRAVQGKFSEQAKSENPLRKKHHP